MRISVIEMFFKLLSLFIFYPHHSMLLTKCQAYHLQTNKKPPKIAGFGLLRRQRRDVAMQRLYRRNCLEFSPIISFDMLPRGNHMGLPLHNMFVVASPLPDEY